MKKMVLAGVLSLGAMNADASEYLDIAYLANPAGQSPGAYIGTTKNGITLLSIQSHGGLSSRLIDTRKKVTQEEIIENSDTVLRALPWPNGYQSGLLANYPALPANAERFQHLGVVPSMNEGEFQEVVQPLIKMIESYVVGNDYLYDSSETQGYRAVSVGGDWVAFADGPKGSSSNIYSCDISGWNLSDTFQKI
ncbi:hypothetical protein [Bacterioplanoides sp.]|uniref:hypothetical protein n=1 Tax=Bacterioplanoides sp. TaxID=2066072 RepID=UPI003B58BF5C